MYNSRAIHSGLLYIKNIVLQNGNFLDYGQLPVGFQHVLTWLEYKNITAVIPVVWKLILKRPALEGPESCHLC